MGSSKHKHRNSPRKTSAKRYPAPPLVETRYRMRGMGTLLTMYGRAGEAAETEHRELTKKTEEVREQLHVVMDDKKRARLKKKLDELQRRIDGVQRKMKQLLEGAAHTAVKAASALGHRNDGTSNSPTSSTQSASSPSTASRTTSQSSQTGGHTSTDDSSEWSCSSTD